MQKIKRIILEDEEAEEYEKIMNNFEETIEIRVKEEIESRNIMQKHIGFITGILFCWIPLVILVMIFQK